MGQNLFYLYRRIRIHRYGFCLHLRHVYLHFKKLQLHLVILSATLKARCYLVPNDAPTVRCRFLKPQEGIKPIRSQNFNDIPSVTSIILFKKKGVKIAKSLLLQQWLSWSGTGNKAIILKKKKKCPRCMSSQWGKAKVRRYSFDALQKRSRFFKLDGWSDRAN